MRTDTPYDDQYPTCAYTHAWLRIMGEDLESEDVTRLLGVTPTSTQRRGDPVSPKLSRRLEHSAWFLSTKGVVDSRDARHHLDWLLECIRGKRHAFQSLQARKILVDICCRWDSRSGHGGPTLSPKQMSEIGELGIELWFDIYFAESADEPETPNQALQPTAGRSDV